MKDPWTWTKVGALTMEGRKGLGGGGQKGENETTAIA